MNESKTTIGSVVLWINKHGFMDSKSRWGYYSKTEIFCQKTLYLRYSVNETFLNDATSRVNSGHSSEATFTHSHSHLRHSSSLLLENIERNFNNKKKQDKQRPKKMNKTNFHFFSAEYLECLIFKHRGLGMKIGDSFYRRRYFLRMGSEDNSKVIRMGMYNL